MSTETRMVTVPLTSKGQITIPKVVRERLRIKAKGDLVGFVLDPSGTRVQLTRVEAIPVQEDLTPEEYKTLLRLPRQKGGRRFRTMPSLIADLKR